MSNDHKTPFTDAHTFNQEGKRPTGEDGEILSVPTDDCRKLETMLLELMEIIDSHEIELEDCDRRGHLHCDCLHRKMREIKRAVGGTNTIRGPRTACDHCGGTNIVDNCVMCGAPQCCLDCCAKTTSELVESRRDIDR